MSDPSPKPPASSFTLLSSLTTQAASRAWQTVPHPTLPLLATCFSDKTVRIHHLRSIPPNSSPPPSPSTSSSPQNATNIPHHLDPRNLHASLHSTISGGHKRSIRTVAWKPNLPKGELILATGSFDASVGLWRHVSTLDLVPRPDPSPPSHPDHDHDHDHDHDNEEEEEAEEDDWNYTIALDGHESEVKSVSFSAGGNLLATCSRDKSVWVWEEVGDEEWETVAVLQEHEGDVKCVAWHPEEEEVGSGSYDDEVRLWRDEGDDWGCVWRSGGSKVDAVAAAIATTTTTSKDEAGSDGKKEEGEGEDGEAGHSSTVWALSWEPVHPSASLTKATTTTKTKSQTAWYDRRQRSGPRLLSASDDLSIRVWRRVPKERKQQNQYSIIRARDTGEEWVREAVLPRAHLRSVYAVEWSKRSGLVVSCGGDGRVVVYEEVWEGGGGVDGSEDVAMEGVEGVEGPEGTEGGDQEQTGELARTKWRVLAVQEQAHDVFEVNHVAWLQRPKARGEEAEGEGKEDELIVTSGDDGEVKIWALDLEGARLSETTR